MALFFASHRCNRICADLGLTAFDLSPLEERRIDEILNSSEPATRLRDTYYIGKRKISAMFDLVERLSDHSDYSSDDGNDIDSPRSPDALSYESNIDELSSSYSSISSSQVCFSVFCCFATLAFNCQFATCDLLLF